MSEVEADPTIVRMHVHVPRTIFVHSSGSFDLYAPFFESVCGMRRTDDEDSAGVVLGNEFELKKKIGLGGWDQFHDHARVLFLPGVVLLDDKIELARLLADAPYHPRTYVESVPRHASTRGWWLDKPARGSSGRGIRIVHNPAHWSKEGHVLQEYVNNPLLHKGRYKFDLRVLAIVFSDARVFVYPDAIMRCCGVPYQPLVALAGSRATYTLPMHSERRHLTNVCVQAKYDSTQSHVGVLSREDHLYKDLMPKATAVIHDVLHKWFTRVQSEDEGHVEGSVSGSFAQETHTPKGFRIIGFDVLPLDDGNVTFIEANYQPGLARDGTLGAFYRKALRHMLRCVVDPTWADTRLCSVLPLHARDLASAKQKGLPCVPVMTCSPAVMLAPASLVALVSSAILTLPPLSVSTMLARGVSVLVFGSQTELVASRLRADMFADDSGSSSSTSSSANAHVIHYGSLDVKREIGKQRKQKSDEKEKKKRKSSAAQTRDTYSTLYQNRYDSHSDSKSTDTSDCTDDSDSERGSTLAQSEVSGSDEDDDVQVPYGPWSLDIDTNTLYNLSVLGARKVAGQYALCAVCFTSKGDVRACVKQAVMLTAVSAHGDAHPRCIEPRALTDGEQENVTKVTRAYVHRTYDVRPHMRTHVIECGIVLCDRRGVVHWDPFRRGTHNTGFTAWAMSYLREDVNTQWFAQCMVKFAVST